MAACVSFSTAKLIGVNVFSAQCTVLLTAIIRSKCIEAHNVPFSVIITLRLYHIGVISLKTIDVLLCEPS
jgi:hypothetical protein